MSVCHILRNRRADELPFCVRNSSSHFTTSSLELLWQDNHSRSPFTEIEVGRQFILLVDVCLDIVELTVLGHHYRWAVASRLYIDHNARVVFGKVQQIVLYEFPASDGNESRWLHLHECILLLPNASRGTMILAEFQRNSLQLTHKPADAILQWSSRKSAPKKQVAIRHPSNSFRNQGSVQWISRMKFLWVFW